MSTKEESRGAYVELAAENKAKYKKHAEEFRHVFGVGLKPYFDLVTGFDVIKFDQEFIRPPDGTSTANVIKARYGPEAVDLIKKLF